MHRSPILRRAAALGVAALAMAGLAACDPLPVLELTVTATTDDLVDVAPGDGVCEATPGAGDCTLRAAVMEANATPPGTDVRVVLAPGSVHTLTRHVDCSEENWGGIDETVEDLDVNRDLTVIGNGATITTAGGDFTDPVFGTLQCWIGVFDHHSGRLRVENASLDGESFGSGAALRNGATAELVDVTAWGVGGSQGVALHNYGTLTLVRVEVGGSVFGSRQFPSSAPWAVVWNQRGSLVLLDSEVGGGHVIPQGGSTDVAGIHVAAGQATLIQSIVTNQRGSVWVGPSFEGDGIDARGPVTLIRSTVAANGAGRDVVGTAAVEASGSLLGSCGTLVTSLGHNADADGSCLGAGHATDLVASPTTFGDFFDEQRWLPAAGSAVLDVIPPGTPDLCDGGWPTDQRGAPRLSGSACDIGALERQPTDP